MGVRRGIDRVIFIEMCETTITDKNRKNAPSKIYVYVVLYANIV